MDSSREGEDRHLVPERLATVADHLDEAIDEIRSWGVRIGNDSRLPHASRLLRNVAASGQFPSATAELSLVAEALRHAQEFVEVANVLPKDPISSLHQALQIAVGGELRPVDSTTGPHLQLQTQLWVGAMFAHSEAEVGVLAQPGNGKNPDFIISNGTLRYAVEVKRPNGVLDAHNIVRKAARQIRHPQFHGGVIVVDLTDCIDPNLRHRVGRGPDDFREVGDEVINLLETLHIKVFDDESEMLRLRREHVFGIIAFCRAAYWNLDDLIQPHLIRHVGVRRYWRRDHRTLRAHRARWLTDLVDKGIRAAGHEAAGISMLH